MRSCCGERASAARPAARCSLTKARVLAFALRPPPDQGCKMQCTQAFPEALCASRHQRRGPRQRWRTTAAVTGR